MLEYTSLGILIFTALVLFYGVIVIHDIPYEIAKHRNHPHQDTIHVAGWISLLTLNVIWPFLWIWATLYREDRGWGEGLKSSVAADDDLTDRLLALQEQVDVLEQQIRLAHPNKAVVQVREPG